MKMCLHGNPLGYDLVSAERTLTLPDPSLLSSCLWDLEGKKKKKVLPLNYHFQYFKMLFIVVGGDKNSPQEIIKHIILPFSVQGPPVFVATIMAVCVLRPLWSLDLVEPISRNVLALKTWPM